MGPAESGGSARFPAGREAEGRAPARAAALRCGAHGLRAAIPGWRRPLQEGPLPALPAPSLASADADVGAGSWRDARISAGRLLGAGAPRYLPSGAGAGASRAGCMLQRETPGCRGDRGSAKPRPPLLPFAGWGFQAGHLSHNPHPQSGAGGASSPSIPRILPRAWKCGGCARPRSVRQPPGSGREPGEHLRPHPSRFPTVVRPPFLPASAGLAFAPSQVPSGLGFASRADLLTSSPAAVADVYFCCSLYASLWQGRLRADGHLFFCNDWCQEACGWPLRATKSH